MRFFVLVLTMLAAVSCHPASESDRAAGKTERRLYQLKDYQGHEAIKNQAVRAMLERNGFAVTDVTSKQMYRFYMGKHNYFITTDSAFHCFHVLYEDLVQQIEVSNAILMQHFCRRLLEKASQRLERGGVPRDVGEHLFVHVAVPARLHGLKTPLPAVLRKREKHIAQVIQQEVQRILEAKRSSVVSPYTGRAHDYTRYKVRGLYAEKPGLGSYFRAVVWFGLHGFAFGSDQGLEGALLLAEVMEDGDLTSMYGRLSEVFTALLGAPDDLGPQEVRAAVAGLPAGASPDQKRRALMKTRKPRLNTSILYGNDLVQKLCLLGGRFTPDAALLFGIAGQRLDPSGVHVMAGMGSEAARAWCELPAKAQMQALTRCFRDDFIDNHYRRMYDLLGQQLAPAPENAPAYARTPAWRLRCLNSALAQWASIKHTWQLHTKIPIYYRCMALREPVPIVEPNPKYFRMIESVTAELDAVAQKYGIGCFVPNRDLPTLRRLTGLAGKLKALDQAGAQAWKKAEKVKRRGDANARNWLEVLAEGMRGVERQFGLQPGDLDCLGRFRFEGRLGGVNAGSEQFWPRLRALVERLEKGGRPSESEARFLAKAFSSPARGKLKELRKLCGFLADCSQALLDGKALSGTQAQNLGRYGDTLLMLERDTNVDTGMPDDNPLVADVFDMTGTGMPPTPLMAATGRPHEIIVLVDYQGKKYIARGGVMVYYEWWQSGHKRLTDKEWRDQVAEGRTPPPPAFVKHFWLHGKASATESKKP